MNTKRAFSLIELLVMIAVTALLAAISITGFQAARQAAERSREIHAIRQLIVAYLAAEQDHGHLLPGLDRTVGEVVWPDGSLAAGVAAQRYPYRLGPYYDYSLDGVILVNRSTQAIDRSDPYGVSLSPAFGINLVFVGGEKLPEGDFVLAPEVAKHSSQAPSVLVFASAGRMRGTELVHGFHRVTPPRIHGLMWADSSVADPNNPDDHGNVHARHLGKAVTAFLDGSIRPHTLEELRDMRLWSPRALESNNPDYNVTSDPRDGRR